MALPLSYEEKKQYNAETNENLHKDIQLANNERARRRRARQRRNSRRRTTARNAPRNVARQPTQRGIQPSRFTLADIINPELSRFAESVTHPFSNDAIGTLCPDTFSDLVIPCTDRLDFDLSPAFFTRGSGTSTSEPTLLGVLMWYMPRCLANGWLTRDEGTDDYVYPPTPVASAGSTDGNASVPLDLYTLCTTAIWESGTQIRSGIYTIVNGSEPTFTTTYIQIRYSRFNSIADNCDRARILGAGLKLWSEEAPINTGGYCYGGWITQDDLLSGVFEDNGSGLINIQDKFRFINRQTGLKGTTVRYSPLQTAEQLESEFPKLPQRLWAVDAINGSIIETKGNDLSVNDTVTPGSYVPVTLWKYNTTDDGNGPYTLKVASVVHVEGTPGGNSPFQSRMIGSDPQFQYIKSYLENPREFPPAVGGHSFKSFMTKARHVIGKASKHASNFSKFLQLVDNFAGSTSQLL